MNGDDGDFSDPASRAPGARERAAAAARGAVQSQPGLVRRAGVTGTLLAIGLPLLIILVVGAATFADWNTAPEIPYQVGIGALSVGRILVSTFGLLFIVLAGAVFFSNEGEAWSTGMSPATLRTVFAGLLIFSVWLEASGELRRGVIKAFGKVPGGPTRLQTFEAAKAEWNRKFPTFQGAPQAAAFFDGAWRRHGHVTLSDVRRVVLRRVDGNLRARIWHECAPGGASCDAGEVAVRLHARGDGSIESLEAEVEIPEGRVWLRMAAGRNDSQPAVLVTQVYFTTRPEWQVSSGRVVQLRREKPAVALVEFAGDWSRATPGGVGDFTRLTVRQTGPRALAIRAWARCAALEECDLGERPAQVDLDADGRAREAQAIFERDNLRLRLALEPPFQGNFEVVSELSRFGPVKGQVARRGGGTSQSLSSESTRAVLVRGHAAASATLPVPSPAATSATAPAVPSPAAGNCTEAQTLHAIAALGCDAALGALTRSAPPDLEVRNERGLTALALAVLNGRHEAVRLLLTLGADANAAVRFAPAARPRASGLEQAQRPELAEGSTPLILAGDQVMAALLLRFGADHRVKNSYGWSALFYYTHHGSVEMIDTLLAAGADVNDTANVDPSHAGSTPLMWAAYMNRTAHLQALLKYKPRLDIRDRAGKTALDYARGFGHRDAMRLLEVAVSAAR